MRVGIIGMGWVGTSVAMSLLSHGGVRELYLNDVRREIAEGEAMDLAHAAPFLRNLSVRATSLEEMLTCDALVVAAGRHGGPGESRLALLRDNVLLVRALGEQLVTYAGLIVMVTNPVDVLTHVMLEASGLSPSRVFGTGTLLDTARMRHTLGMELGVAPQSVHVHVLGEHGDSQVAAFSSARIGGVPLRGWPGWQRAREPLLAEEVRGAAQQIIIRKGATNHAIGLATAYLLRWALGDERRVLTVSRLQEGNASLSDVCMSLPAVVGRQGVEVAMTPNLDDREHEALFRSADVLRAAKAGLADILNPGPDPR